MILLYCEAQGKGKGKVGQGGKEYVYFLSLQMMKTNEWKNM